MMYYRKALKLQAFLDKREQREEGSSVMHILRESFISNSKDMNYEVLLCVTFFFCLLTLFGPDCMVEAN